MDRDDAAAPPASSGPSGQVVLGRRRATPPQTRRPIRAGAAPENRQVPLPFLTDRCPRCCAPTPGEQFSQGNCAAGSRVGRGSRESSLASRVCRLEPPKGSHDRGGTLGHVWVCSRQTSRTTTGSCSEPQRIWSLCASVWRRATRCGDERIDTVRGQALGLIRGQHVMAVLRRTAGCLAGSQFTARDFGDKDRWIYTCDVCDKSVLPCNECGGRFRW